MPHSKSRGTNFSDEWNTPRQLFRELDYEFNFTLDPCCTHESALCEKHYTIEENGLSQDWSGDRVYMNPPYNKYIMPHWIQKAYESKTLVVALLPASTGTKWFHDFVYNKAEIRFLKGRLKYSGVGSAPFPSMVVIWRGK